MGDASVFLRFLIAKSPIKIGSKGMFGINRRSINGISDSAQGVPAFVGKCSTLEMSSVEQEDGRDLFQCRCRTSRIKLNTPSQAGGIGGPLELNGGRRIRLGYDEQL